MDATTNTPADVITCAKPGCSAAITCGESFYIDGCGQVCSGCFGPVLYDIEPPY